MERNRMEQEFRSKLNEREIKPSDAAWDRLDAMLTVSEKSKPKSNKNWVYVAAGFVIFFAVGAFLLLNQNQTVQSIPIQEQLVDSNETSNSPIEETKPIDLKNQGEGDLDVNKFVEKKKTKVFSRQVLVQKENKVSLVNNSEVLTNQKSINQEVKDLSEKTFNETEVLADNVSVDLLQRIGSKQVSVNPNSLLNSVENELNLEFRESRFDKVKKNFKTVKSAVANRNYE